MSVNEPLQTFQDLDEENEKGTDSYAAALIG